jgi:hypothetical protein
VSLGILHLLAPRRPQPHKAMASKIAERRAFPQVTGGLSGLKESGAGGTRIHDRRIMSPARQQPVSYGVTWADTS